MHNKQLILGEKRRSFKDMSYKWKNDEPELERIVIAICKYKGVEPIELKKKTRKSHLMNTRQLIYHFAFMSNRITQRYMSKFFNQKRENVSHAVWKVEEDSDNYKILRQQYNEIAALVNPSLIKTHEIGTPRPTFDDNIDTFQAVKNQL